MPRPPASSTSNRSSIMVGDSGVSFRSGVSFGRLFRISHYYQTLPSTTEMTRGTHSHTIPCTRLVAILTLAWFTTFNFSEIGRCLSVSPNAARALVKRARRRAEELAGSTAVSFDAVCDCLKDDNSWHHERVLRPILYPWIREVIQPRLRELTPSGW